MDTPRNARVVNIHEAKSTLSRLIERVLLGEDIMIAKNNVPIVQLVPLTPPTPARVLGDLAGQVHFVTDFDADAEAIAADFDGGDDDPLRVAAGYPVGPRMVAEPPSPGYQAGPARPKRRRRP